MHASEDDIHASTGESAEPKRHDESIEKLHGKHQKSEVVSDQISDGAVGAGSTGVNDTTPTTKAKDDVEVLQQVPSGPPHSVFSSREKHYITFLAAWASFFSPLSANIYFPALTTLARELHKSNTLINLTLTSYMIFQGIAPTVFGDLADMIGRRPVYILGFVIYIGANIGLALQNNYAALFVLRCLQSTGSSGTVALGNGVIADIATSGERGKYISYVSLGPMAAPALAPVLGGVLSQFLGWRAIFWFLTIMAVVYLFVLIVSFPETGRNVVGNGSVPPQGWNVSLLNYLKTRKLEHNEELSRTPTQEDLARQRRLRWPNPVKVLHIITEKDVGLLLLYNALVYTAFYAVTASIPYLFAQIYGFNDLQIGVSLRALLPRFLTPACRALLFLSSYSRALFHPANPSYVLIYNYLLTRILLLTSSPLSPSVSAAPSRPSSPAPSWTTTTGASPAPSTSPSTSNAATPSKTSPSSAPASR